MFFLFSGSLAAYQALSDTVCSCCAAFVWICTICRNNSAGGTVCARQQEAFCCPRLSCSAGVPSPLLRLQPTSNTSERERERDKWERPRLTFTTALRAANHKMAVHHLLCTSNGSLTGSIPLLMLGKHFPQEGYC